MRLRAIAALQYGNYQSSSRRGAAERKIKNGKMETEPDGGETVRTEDERDRRILRKE